MIIQFYTISCKRIHSRVENLKVFDLFGSYVKLFSRRIIMYILYFLICYTMYKQGEVNKMVMLSIKKWGNSNGLRLPKSVMEYLQIHTEDKVKITQEESNGKKRLIIEAVDSDNDLTIEQLFENYKEEKVHVTIQDLGNAVGNEKW